MTDQRRLNIHGAEFIFGAPSISAIRKQPLPEIAVVGRSNVGKSTFINRLVGRKLARVSGNPGSTRELNFYRIEGSLDQTEFKVALVDMPGFGFAKLSKDEREKIAKVSVDFLRERRQLKAVVLLNDCRREPQADELAIQELCAEHGISCVVVLTKFDTLRQNDKPKALRQVASAYRLEKDDVLYTGHKIDSESVWARLLAII